MVNNGEKNDGKKRAVEIAGGDSAISDSCYV